MDFPKDTMVGVGISREAGEAWPVFRLSQMRDPHDEREVETWRRLFEAAPDLLRIARAYVELADSVLDSFSQADWPGLADALEDARAAIARAEGGAA